MDDVGAVVRPHLSCSLCACLLYTIHIVISCRIVNCKRHPSSIDHISFAVLLQELCADPNNVVVVFSGSETSKLEETFVGLPVWLAAENGVYLKAPKGADGPAAEVRVWAWSK